MGSSIQYILALGLFFPTTLIAQEDTRILRQRYCSLTLTEEETRKIEEVIDRLVFSEGNATNQPVLQPGVIDKSEEYGKRFKKVREAFSELQDMKVKAIPVLVRHFNDKRQSIPFRNHYLENSVGDACYWAVFFNWKTCLGGTPAMAGVVWVRVGSAFHSLTIPAPHLGRPGA